MTTKNEQGIIFNKPKGQTKKYKGVEKRNEDEESQENENDRIKAIGERKE